MIKVFWILVVLYPNPYEAGVNNSLWSDEGEFETYAQCQNALLHTHVSGMIGARCRDSNWWRAQPRDG